MIVQLKSDHNRMDWILGNLEKLLRDLPDSPGSDTTTRVRGELTGLAAIMETHFRYEEKKLIAALNSMDVPGWRANRPDFLRSAE